MSGKKVKWKEEESLPSEGYEAIYKFQYNVNFTLAQPMLNLPFEPFFLFTLTRRQDILCTWFGLYRKSIISSGFSKGITFHWFSLDAQSLQNLIHIWCKRGIHVWTEQTKGKQRKKSIFGSCAKDYIKNLLNLKHGKACCVCAVFVEPINVLCNLSALCLVLIQLNI